MNETVIVTCRGNAEILGKLMEKDDLFATRVYMPLSHDKDHYAIVLEKDSFPLSLIRNSECFIINFLTEEFSKEEIDYNIYPGRHMDKFERLGLRKEESRRLDCPRLKDAKESHECRLINEFEVKDKIIIIGKVLN